MTVPSYIDLCDFYGVRPCCGETECRCSDDAELAADLSAHAEGCLCCADEVEELRTVRLDQERSAAIPRQRWPIVRPLGCGAWSRIVETASHIDSGSL